ncbi:siderophore-interacting protein [Sphingobacterium sp. DR205]|nr:siderophore-interacting protein [Sphingobacterium sp. DR205]
MRNYLRKDLGWKREELYVYSFWKIGVAEDKSANKRRKKSEEVNSQVSLAEHSANRHINRNGGYV